jgi:hypothetical protein
MAQPLTITSANAVYMLAVLPIFPTPQQLQGFSADLAFDTESAEVAQTVMGVDGQFSAGFIPYPTRQTISIMPDSPSAALFEQWIALEKAAREKFFATAQIRYPSVGRQYTGRNGVLTGFIAMAPARRVLEARGFVITWGDISSAPL